MASTFLNGPILVSVAVIMTLGMALMLMVVVALAPVFGSPPGGQAFVDMAGVKLAFLEPLLGIALFYAFGEAVIHRHTLATALEKEVSAARTLAWSIDHANPSRRSTAHAALNDYLFAVTEREWPAMARAGESPEAVAALIRLNASIGALDAVVDDHAWARRARMMVRAMGEQRDFRLARSSLRLSSVITATAATVIILLTGFVWILGAADFRPRFVMTLLLYTAILSVFIGVVILYNPFIGDWALSPEPFMQIRDRA